MKRNSELHLWLNYEGMKENEDDSCFICESLAFALNYRKNVDILHTTQVCLLSFIFADKLFVHYNNEVISLKFNESDKDFYSKLIMGITEDLSRFPDTKNDTEIIFEHLKRYSDDNT